jgi:IclR family pca regulon transcriptional regulator
VPISRDDRDFVQSLDRGLAVLEAFDSHHLTLSLREVADAAGISRPAARRLLLTLEALGYLSSDGPTFRLTTRVFTFASGYLGSRAIHEVAQRHLAAFSADVDESSVMSVLDDTDVLFVVRVPVHRVHEYMLGLGGKRPAYVSSPGRVLLAQLGEAALDRYFARAALIPLTGRTIADESDLRAELRRVAEQGWSLVDQEYETNMRSIAVPIRDLGGDVVAALSCMCHVERVPLERLTGAVLDRLRQAADDIEAELGVGALSSRAAR